MATTAGSGGKAAELAQLLEAVRAKVRERHPDQIARGVALPDLLPLLHARDAAYGKVASIGSVNPRRGGPVNSLIQGIKRLVARSLNWLLREQVEFNQATINALEATLSALQENNRVLSELASRIEAVDSRLTALTQDSLDPAVRDMNDAIAHWIAWRSEWEHKLSTNEIQFLRGLADLQNAFHHRATLMESNFRDMVKGQHDDFEGALNRSGLDIQQRLWADLDKSRQEMRVEMLGIIHDELRLLRQKAWMFSASPAAPQVAQQPAAAAPQSFDQWRFNDKFRGPEEYVRKQHEFYLPKFAGARNVLDLGCGRGEFLELLKKHGIAAKGVELNEELAAYTRQRGLAVEQGDMFEYLQSLPPQSLDGIFCAQVVEHLPPNRIPELIQLAASRLARGGVLAIETPNPECLAIFATHFYLDPTHTRPIPPDLLRFYFEEAGFAAIEVHRLAPAIDTMPELAELPQHFRERFFNYLDYAVVGHSS